MRVHEESGRVWSVFGTEMTAGETPRKAAEEWVFQHGEVFGTWPELEQFREARLRTAPEGMERRAFMYRQNMDGLPVVGSSFRVMTEGEPDSGPARVVYVSGRVAIRPQGGLPEPEVTPAEALNAAKADPRGQGLALWSDPALVAIYDDAPRGEAVAYPTWRLVGGSEISDETYTFYVHAVTGAVARYHSNLLHGSDGWVAGTVTGDATPAGDPQDQGPDPIGSLMQSCENDPDEFDLRDIWMAAYLADTETLVADAWTDAAGSYVLEVPAQTQLDIKASLRGPGWEVFDGWDAGWIYGHTLLDPEEELDVVVPQPNSTIQVNFQFNPTPSEHTTAFVNAHKQMSRTWRWLGMEHLDPIPDAPVVVNSDQGSSCNAVFIAPNEFNEPYLPWPQGFLRFRHGEQTQCANAAYSTFIAHEYGHFVHWHLLGIQGAGAFPEGFSDALALLVYDAEIWVRDFKGCGNHGRWPRQQGLNHRYPSCKRDPPEPSCSMNKSFSGWCRGELLSALWLDMRDEFGAADTRDFFLDWMLIAQVPPSAQCPDNNWYDQSAWPGTLVEVLSVADDAHVATICAVFDDRDIEHPDPPPNACEESAGWPCYADCDSNGALDFWDFLCFQNAYLANDPYADCDNNGALDFFDFVCFQSRFIAACP